jgi:hypothetical protein
MRSKIRMSTVPDDPDFADPSAAHRLLPERKPWPVREGPIPPRLPASDHRMAHVAIAMAVLLLCVSACTNERLALSALGSLSPIDDSERRVYDPTTNAETIRLFVCSLAAHGATLVFLLLARITGGRGHRITSVFLFLPLVPGALLALAAGMDALEYVGR